MQNAWQREPAARSRLHSLRPWRSSALSLFTPSIVSPIDRSHRLAVASPIRERSCYPDTPMTNLRGWMRQRLAAEPRAGDFRSPCIHRPMGVPAPPNPDRRSGCGIRHRGGSGSPRDPIATVAALRQSPASAWCLSPAPICSCNPDQLIRSGLIVMPCGSGHGIAFRARPSFPLPAP